MGGLGWAVVVAVVVAGGSEGGSTVVVVVVVVVVVGSGVKFMTSDMGASQGGHGGRQVNQYRVCRGVWITTNVF